ncbi:toll/interleukin-1 receptor domain-containing protein, partial [Frankia sp. Cj3]|uniref:toll/interleukin-1 receptor domain-containing protein n=1 Tax=Frankia sp. Cj3 TaxID=2880976 RepID=UPI001EF4C147
MGDGTSSGAAGGSNDRDSGDDAPATDRPPRVFVSYAHGSPEDDDTVRDLWIFLRSRGIDAKLDKPAAERRQDWPLWMLAEVRAADHVLIIVSPQYRRRSEGEAAADEGRGVQFEAALIREELYRDRPAGMAKFLPVLLPGRSVEDIPAFLGPYSTTHYPVAEISASGMDALLGVLTGQPYEVEPPLGEPWVRATRPVVVPDARVPGGTPLAAGAPRRPAPLVHEIVAEVRLADGWLTTRTVLADTVLGERGTALPLGLDTVWTAQPADPAGAGTYLSDAGHR